mgnify:CR=1 FL=1
MLTFRFLTSAGRLIPTRALTYLSALAAIVPMLEYGERVSACAIEREGAR